VDNAGRMGVPILFTEHADSGKILVWSGLHFLESTCLAYVTKTTSQGTLVFVMQIAADKVDKAFGLWTR